MKKCPKCGSASIKIYNYLDIKAIKCKGCGFDERSQYEVYPEGNTSQKAKARHSPYKAGGHGRVKN